MRVRVTLELDDEAPIARPIAEWDWRGLIGSPDVVDVVSVVPACFALTDDERAVRAWVGETEDLRAARSVLLNEGHEAWLAGDGARVSVVIAGLEALSLRLLDEREGV